MKPFDTEKFDQIRAAKLKLHRDAAKRRFFCCKCEKRRQPCCNATLPSAHTCLLRSLQLSAAHDFLGCFLFLLTHASCFPVALNSRDVLSVDKHLCTPFNLGAEVYGVSPEAVRSFESKPKSSFIDLIAHYLVGVFAVNVCVLSLFVMLSAHSLEAATTLFLSIPVVAAGAVNWWLFFSVFVGRTDFGGIYCYVFALKTVFPLCFGFCIAFTHLCRSANARRKKKVTHVVPLEPNFDLCAFSEVIDDSGRTVEELNTLMRVLERKKQELQEYSGDVVIENDEIIAKSAGTVSMLRLEKSNSMDHVTLV